VGELGGGLESLGLGEAAGLDEIVLDGEARAWGNGRGRGPERRRWAGEIGAAEVEERSRAAM